MWHHKRKMWNTTVTKIKFQFRGSFKKWPWSWWEGRGVESNKEILHAIYARNQLRVFHSNCRCLEETKQQSPD